jgi:hypothetical protein
MSVAQLVVFGSILLAWWFVLMRFYERAWFPPASLFAVGFFLHGFIAPLYYLDIGQINYHDLTQALYLTCFCFLGAVGGYWAAFPLRRCKLLHGNPGHLLGTFGTRLIRGVTIGLLAYITVYVIATGKLLEAKGINAYSTDVSPAERIAKVGLTLPALMGAWLINIVERRGRLEWKDIRLWLACMIWMMILSVLLFARHQAVTAILISVMLFYYRYRNFSVSRLILKFSFVGIIVLQLFAQLRSFNVGIAALPLADITNFFWETTVTQPWMLLLGIATALPGQNVFVEVIKLVPSTHPFRMGETYLKSTLGLLFPRFLGMSSYDDPDLPSQWFHEAYAPEAEHHGFDFSALSEAYLNFGSGMMVIIFIFMGMVVRRASVTVCHSKSAPSVLLGILIIIGLVFGLRSDSNSLLKSICYPFLFILMLRKVERLIIKPALSQNL